MSVFVGPKRGRPDVEFVISYDGDAWKGYEPETTLVGQLFQLVRQRFNIPHDHHIRLQNDSTDVGEEALQRMIGDVFGAHNTLVCLARKPAKLRRRVFTSPYIDHDDVVRRVYLRNMKAPTKWKLVCHQVTWWEALIDKKGVYSPLDMETIGDDVEFTKTVKSTGKDAVCDIRSSNIPGIDVFWIMQLLDIDKNDAVDTHLLPASVQHTSNGKAGDLAFGGNDYKSYLSQNYRSSGPLVIYMLERKAHIIAVGVVDDNHIELIAGTDGGGGLLLDYIVQDLPGTDIVLDSINTVIADKSVKNPCAPPGPLQGRARLNEFYQRHGFQNINSCSSKKPRYKLIDGLSEMHLCK
jgi:hypothetical protein